MIRYITALVLMLLSHNQAWNQSPMQLNRFITDFVSTQNFELPLYYREEIPRHNHRHIIETLTTAKIYGYNYEKYGRSGQDSLILTEKESFYLQQQFNGQTGKIWTIPFFKDWHIVSEDSLKHYNEIDQYFLFAPHRFGGRLYTFSKPVFFRGDSLFLFYWEYWCGSKCGEGHFALFQKQNGKWKYRFSLFTWQS